MPECCVVKIFSRNFIRGTYACISSCSTGLSMRTGLGGRIAGHSKESLKNNMPAGYALFLSPNLTPQRDMYFIEKLVGLRRDSFQVSTLFTCLFNAMGIYPLIFLGLLQPSGKSDNKVRFFFQHDQNVAQSAWVRRWEGGGRKHESIPTCPGRRPPPCPHLLPLPAWLRFMHPAITEQGERECPTARKDNTLGNE